ncbi:MarR family winged helix-turn-helix transcriptional regulator [Hansschlegelia sp.]|uniref:MarR family winged helix-turn-helix transcriptional regulator n=1 Tax=Hansschlegelia sp. TaxID=2041892 RepID=UPI002CBA244F|nr:MarR family winged helix-turn-helix transcriptional regulator [Hansschlegelia sp.]HVI27093.1 MarR family winged helix-turn-helix transcriptional regulator [Hansschlegelia sp.]
MNEQAKSKAKGLFERPGFMIRRLHQIYVSIYLQECEGFGTTPVQSSVLQVLLVRPGADQVSLAADIGIDRTTTSNVLSRLEARGLVRREATEKDRRIRRSYLTEAGQTLIIEMQDALERAHRRLIAPLPEDERRLFITQLHRLVEANNDVGRALLRYL